MGDVVICEPQTRNLSNSWWGKTVNMVMRFVGNVGIWREILGFEGKFGLSVHKKTQQIVGKLASFPGSKHFSSPAQHAVHFRVKYFASPLT